MLKKTTLLLLVVLSLFGVPGNCFAAMDVPQEAIQKVIDASLDLQSTYAIGTSYREFSTLYSTLAKEEGRFSAKYPKSKYATALHDLMFRYSMVDLNRLFVVDPKISKEDKETARNEIPICMAEAKKYQDALMKLMREDN